jgi:hypothetical protein
MMIGRTKQEKPHLMRLNFLKFVTHTVVGLKEQLVIIQLEKYTQEIRGEKITELKKHRGQ